MPLQHHIQYLETQPAEQEGLLLGLNNLVAISYVSDREVLKTCLDYWNVFVADVYTTQCQASVAASLVGAAGTAGDGGFSFGSPGATANGVAGPGMARKLLYTDILKQLRALMINRMAKPEVGRSQQ